jgi:glycosyltransferase involved in cell wall biosynthesis
MPTAKILYIAPDNPWNRWTNSGVTYQLCSRLRDMGLLYGALSRFAPDLKELHRESWLRNTLEKARYKLRGPDTGKWQRMFDDEKSGVIGELLSTLPEGSRVVYHYVVPKIDPSLPIRRYLFQDMSVDDGVKGGGFGYANKTTDEIAALHERHAQAYPHIEGVISFASFVADSLAARYEFPRSKVFAIGAGPIRTYPKLGQQGVERYKARRILFVGRAFDRKGGPIVLDAFRRVRARMPDATLTVVSSMAKFSPQDGVTHIPFASNEQLHELFSTSSVFTMPSVCETWGLVYCEAAAHGLPTASFGNWAVPDIVNDGVTGVLTRDFTADGLASALLDALGDPECLCAMGNAAIRRSEDVLDWPHVMDRLLAVVAPEALRGRAPTWMRPRA